MENKNRNENELKKLAWFWDFVELTKLQVIDVAALTGVSRVTVNAWRNADDLPLRHAFDLVQRCGYILDISLAKTGDAATPLRKIGVTKYVVSTEGETPRVKNLAFLELALLQQHISKKKLAELTGFTPSAIYNWFREDNVKWSVLYHVAYSLGLSIFIDIHNVSESVPGNKDGQVYTKYRITKQKQMLIDTGFSKIEGRGRPKTKADD